MNEHNRRAEVKAVHGFETWCDHIQDDARLAGPAPLFLTDHEPFSTSASSCGKL